MGSKSNYLERAVLDLALGQTAIPAVPTVYVALFSTIPDGSDGSGVELAGNGYERLAVPNDPTNWPAATGGSPALKSNGLDLLFPAATADWLKAYGFALYDSSTGGHELFWSALQIPTTVLGGVRARFPAGSLVVTET